MLEHITDLLTAADNDSNEARAIGSILIAVAQLVEVVEAQNARITALEAEKAEAEADRQHAAMMDAFRAGLEQDAQQTGYRSVYE